MERPIWNIRLVMIITTAALCVITPSVWGETSCEAPEWFKEGNWYATRLSKRGGVEIGIFGEAHTSLPADTISIPGGMLLEEYYHTVERPEEFIMVTEGWKNQYPRIYWLLNARSGELRKLLEVPEWRTLGGVALGCQGARVLISVGGSYDSEFSPMETSIIYLIDVDSGAVIRKWEGLYFESCYREAQVQTAYDKVTNSFWLGHAENPFGLQNGSRANEDMVRVDCATCDTIGIDKNKLLGKEPKSYWIQDIYHGLMLIGTHDDNIQIQEQKCRRMTLVDLAEEQPIADWSIYWQDSARDFSIAEDSSGIVFYVDDEKEKAHRFYLPVGATEAVEVTLEGGRIP